MSGGLATAYGLDVLVLGQALRQLNPLIFPFPIPYLIVVDFNWSKSLFLGL